MSDDDVADRLDRYADRLTAFGQTSSPAIELCRTAATRLRGDGRLLEPIDGSRVLVRLPSGAVTVLRDALPNLCATLDGSEPDLAARIRDAAARLGWT